jgi:hypothetical protein
MQTGKKLTNTKTRTHATPIPPRASAHPEAVVKLQPRYARAYRVSVDDDMSQLPTTPPVMWQYETAEYVAESSLAALSLLTPRHIPRHPAIDVLETQPSLACVQRRHRTAPAENAGRDLADVDTVPPAMEQARTQQAVEIADIPTVPPEARGSRRSGELTAPRARCYPTEEELCSPARNRTELDKAPVLHFNPFDHLRWWLLYPGRLESLLWSGGIVLLVGLTVLLSVVTVLSLVVSHSGQAGTPHSNTGQSAMASPLCGALFTANGDIQKCIIATASSPDGLQISVFSTAPFMVDTSVHLQGHGFSPAGRVIITHDANLPCQPATVQADQQGDITLVLLLNSNAGWSPGNHTLVLLDSASGHRVMLAFVLCKKNAEGRPEW